MLPSVGVSRPAISFISVVLPDPLRPTNATIRPGTRSNVIFFKKYYVGSRARPDGCIRGPQRIRQNNADKTNCRSADAYRREHLFRPGRFKDYKLSGSPPAGRNCSSGEPHV